jgi:predicted phage-related endonuclease
MTQTEPAAAVSLDGLRDHLNAYSLAAAEIEKWKSIQAQARAAIETALGDAEIGTVDGAKAVTWIRSERTTIDTKRLQADLPPEVLAPYTRTTVVRTFKPVAAGATR